MKHSFCEDWEFTRHWTEAFGKGLPVPKQQAVRLPHTCREVPLHYATPADYEMVCGYRKRFRVPPVQAAPRLFVRFDGAAHQAVVRVNGRVAGQHRGGYTGFTVEITDLVDREGENLLTVQLDTREDPTIPPFGFVIDYLTYGGLYREVWLEATAESRLTDLFVYTPTLQEAVVQWTAELTPATAAVRIRLETAEGTLLAEQTAPAAETGKMQLSVPEAQPWDTEHPVLHHAIAELLNASGQPIDRKQVTFGFRTAEFRADGFYLNGKKTFLRGLNRHQSYPYIGYAAPESLQREDARILQEELHCTAVRTSHYPQSQYFLDECDRRGLLVFTELPGWQHIGDAAWKDAACAMLQEMILQNRNHPSIIMWSIGNEIPEQWSKEGVQIAKRLQDICHQYDPSRPVTQGMDKAEDALKSGFAQVMDVPGFNYRVHKYYKNIEQLPQGFLLGSETASTVSSRGVYKFPVVVSDKATYPDGQCSSYDTEYCSWSNLPDDDWKMQDDYSWVIGEFVWTGYDYLGEPTPYDTYWPSRSSYFGICDLAGLPKDRYYMYRARWNEQQHTTHLLPHWNWKGREGKVTPVYCYTDGVEGELFVNGNSQGRVRKDKSSRLDRYRLRWNNVKYEPGEIRVVTYNQYGEKVGEDVKRTAGEPAQMKFSVETPDHEPIACMVEGCTDEHNVLLNADGNDLAFITVSLQDKDGNECPLADDELTFEVSGAGTFKAACNGDATSLEPFTQPQMKLFSGKLVVIVQSSKQKGDIILKVKDSKRNIEKSITLQAI